MAGLEVVVRPVVFTNIRPAPARALPPLDDPESGFAVIKGNGAKQVDLNYSFSWTFSKSREVETERRVDTARVYKMDDGGIVDKKTYVDIEVANMIKTKGGMRPTDDIPPGTPLVPVGGPPTGTPKPPEKGMWSEERGIKYFAPVRPGENIKVINRNGKRIYVPG